MITIGSKSVEILMSLAGTLSISNSSVWYLFGDRTSTVFVLLNAHCAEVMIGCAFIYWPQKTRHHTGLSTAAGVSAYPLLGCVHWLSLKGSCCQFQAVTLEKGGCAFNRTCALNRTNTVYYLTLEAQIKSR